MATPYDFDLGINSTPDMTTPDYGFSFGTEAGGTDMGMFSGQLDGYQANFNQPTWGQKFMSGLNDFGQMGAKNMGALNMGLNAITGLANLYSSKKQMGLYEQQLNQQREQWDKNYETQKQMTNEQLYSRQRARVAANPNAESVSSYMDKWGVK